MDFVASFTGRFARSAVSPSPGVHRAIAFTAGADPGVMPGMRADVTRSWSKSSGRGSSCFRPSGSRLRWNGCTKRRRVIKNSRSDPPIAPENAGPQRKTPCFARIPERWRAIWPCSWDGPASAWRGADAIYAGTIPTAMRAEAVASVRKVQSLHMENDGNSSTNGILC